MLFDFREGDCTACGRPVRRHFDPKNHKIDCARLAKIDQLAVGQAVEFWHHEFGSAVRVNGRITGITKDRWKLRIDGCFNVNMPGVPLAFPPRLINTTRVL